MAPKTGDEDFKFIMTCIKHSPPAAKPDFDAVAKELGAKSASACYHRHWVIMKKWGLAGGGVGKARRAGAPGINLLSTPTGSKRKAASKSESGSNGSGKDNDGSDKSITKKARVIKKVPLAPAIKTEDAEVSVDESANDAVDSEDSDEHNAEVIQDK